MLSPHRHSQEQMNNKFTWKCSGFASRTLIALYFFVCYCPFDFKMISCDSSVTKKTAGFPVFYPFRLTAKRKIR
jgi:hypothetical protein